MTDQTAIVGILRLQRQEEADELLVVLDELERLGPRADFLGDAVQLVVEDIAQPLGEDQREDELLVFRRILRAADGTRRIPDPGFERFIAVAVIRHCQRRFYVGNHELTRSIRSSESRALSLQAILLMPSSIAN